jgi:hypothetical protein
MQHIALINPNTFAAQRRLYLDPSFLAYGLAFPSLSSFAKGPSVTFSRKAILLETHRHVLFPTLQSFFQLIDLPVQAPHIKGFPYELR